MNIRSITFFSMVFIGTSISHLGANSTEAQEKLHQAITNDSSQEIKEVIVSSAPRSNNEETTEWSFLRAILSNNTEEIKKAVQKVIAEGKNGNAPILWAALLEKPHAAQILLECGAQIEPFIVEYAICTNNTQTALALVRGGVDISNTLDSCMKQCFNNARAKDMNSTLELMQELINLGYDANSIWEKSPEVYSAFQGKALELFIQNGAEQRQLKNKGYPLFEAIRLGANGAIKALLNAGAKINLAAKGYMQDRALTPLFLAIKAGNIQSIRILLDSGANINQTCSVNPNAEEITPLAFAISRRNAAIVKLLLDNGATSQFSTKQ